MIPPLVGVVAKAALPYAVAAAVGASVAWWVQGLRVTAAQQDLIEYRQEQKDALQTHRENAERDRLQQGKNYAAEKEKLVAQIEAGKAFERCVAAGKCGVRKPTACAASIRLPTTGSPDAVGTDTVPLAPGATTQDGDPVVGDCAVTTLMLNRLQEAIESQPGF